MRTVSDAEVRKNLGAILDEVAQGTEIARLVPSDKRGLSRQEFLKNAAEIRSRQRLNRSRAEDLVREDRDR